MREKIKDIGRLKHILDAINTLTEQKVRYTFEEVVADPNYQIRPTQLWNTVVNDIPALKPYIERYYTELDRK